MYFVTDNRENLDEMIKKFVDEQLQFVGFENGRAEAGTNLDLQFRLLSFEKSSKEWKDFTKELVNKIYIKDISEDGMAGIIYDVNLPIREGTTIDDIKKVLDAVYSKGFDALINDDKAVEKEIENDEREDR